MSPKGSPATDDAALVRWDRPRWISVFSSHSPTIREVTESLGLGLSASSSTTNRGIPKFDNPDYRKLSSDVTRLSKELPKERDALLDFAADPRSLDAELEELLATFGPAIWGRDTDRTCLLAPDPAKKTYPKDLYYEDPDDKQTLKIHLHRWIIIKACYYIRNMKLKRPSAANDYDTLADLEGDGDPLSPLKPHMVVKSPLPSQLHGVLSPLQSPNGTPQSLSPPASTSAGAESAVKAVGGKKRKSSVFTSWSDGEDMASTPAKRPYQSQTLPLQRKSPRKSLKSFSADSPVSENTPPIPGLGQSRHGSLSSTAGPASTTEAGRPLLTPLSSNDLNGTVRAAGSAPPPGGFTAVNASGFAAGNTAPSAGEAAPQNGVPGPRNYSSPYDTSPYGPAPNQGAQNPSQAPPLNTAPAPAAGHGFQAINSPTITNGVSARNSPVVQHSAHPLVPSQHSTQAQAQPVSRSNTPIMHHTHRTPLTHQRSSRSNTPIAPASSAPPVQAIQAAKQAPASNVQSTSAPAVQPVSAPHVQSSGTPRAHTVAVLPVPNVPGAIHYPPQVQPVLKSHSVEPSIIHPQASSAIDLSLLQCEVLGSLMQYLFPKPSSPPDEAVLLHKIETLWHLGASIFRKQTGGHYDLQAKVLLSWVTERRKIAQLRHALTYAPGVPAAEMVDRLLAMNDLRVMRLKWKNMSSAEGLSAEDLLCRTFAIMTNTEGTEYLFKDGLERLSDGVFEFLRSEDMRILMHKR